jgi:hypothetical protein
MPDDRMLPRSRVSLPIEYTRRIREKLFLGQEDEARTDEPLTFGGRLAWLGGRSIHWLLLILAIVNLALVVFDFTYFTLRPHYLRFVPELVHVYDPIKGSAPHRTTEAYIERADLTLRRLTAGDRGPGTQALLKEMRDRSSALFQEDPFSGSGQAGLFEQIKNRMRDHTHRESSKQAFLAYWSAENFEGEAQARKERAFFDSKIRPVLHRTYYRVLGEDGHPFSKFWLIDLCFVPFFAAEFLLRGLAVVGHSYRYPSWKAYSYARWYDLFYFIPLAQYVGPFGQVAWIHLFRVVSVGKRMQRLGLVNPVEVPQQYAVSVLDLITDLVSVRLLTNFQDGVRKFDLDAAIANLTPEQRGAVREFFEQHAAVVVRRILPEVQPEIKALARFNARVALDRSELYQRLRGMPFIGTWPERHLDEIVDDVVDGLQVSLDAAVSSAEYRRLSGEIVVKAVDAAREEFKHLQSETTIKGLVIDLLEEQKRKLLA